jgi:hypothetical protein
MIDFLCRTLRSMADYLESLKGAFEFADSLKSLDLAADKQEKEADSVEFRHTDRNPMARCAAMTNARVNAQDITKALGDPDERVRLAAIRHPNAAVEHFQKGLLDSDPAVQQTACERLSQAYGS